MLKTESTVRTAETAPLQAHLATVKTQLLTAQPGRERFCLLALQAIIEGKINQSRSKENEQSH